jgi:hypothetical protein
MSDVTDWFNTAAGNDQGTPPDFAPEGGVQNADFNNIVRELQASIRREFNSGGWFEYGDGDGPYSAVFVSASQFDILGSDVTARYQPNTKIRITQGATVLFGIISASVVNVSDTRVTVILVSGSIANATIDKVELGDIGGQSPSPVESLIRDADRDTFVTTEQSPDDDAVVGVADGQQVFRGSTKGTQAPLQPGFGYYYEDNSAAQDNATGAGFEWPLVFPTKSWERGAMMDSSGQFMTAVLTGIYDVDVAVALANINENATEVVLEITRSDGVHWRWERDPVQLTGNVTDYPIQMHRKIEMLQGQTLTFTLAVSGMAGNTIDIIGSDDRNRTELSVMLLG